MNNNPSPEEKNQDDVSGVFQPVERNSFDRKELRIGNWVQLKKKLRRDDAIRSTVDWISAYDERCIGLAGNALRNRPDQLEGIPLTPEILLKAGFANAGRYYIGDRGYNIFRLGKVELMQPKKNDPFILAIYETKILFVHHLQNLYFALTGEELAISL